MTRICREHAQNPARFSAFAFVAVWVPSTLRGEVAIIPSACPAGGRVAVIGDSISDQARDETVRSLAAAGFDVGFYDAAWLRRTTVDGALMGNPVPSGLSVVRAFVTEFDVDCWVVALGTNDIGVADSDRYADDINDLMRSIPLGDVVFWVGVGVGERAYPAKPGAQWRAAAFNQTLQNLVSRWSQLVYVDFAATVLAPHALDTDGVHLGSLGRQIRAKTIADALGRSASPARHIPPLPTRVCGGKSGAGRPDSRPS